MELTELRGLGPRRKEALEKAGIKTVEELAHADVDALAAPTGISADQLRDWQAEIKKRGTKAPQAAPPSVEEVVKDAKVLAEKATRLAEAKAEKMRVILKDKAERARVRVGEAVHDGVPIFTLKRGETEDAVIARIKADAVVLQEKADTALVKIGEVWHREVPIFEEKVQKAGEGAKDLVREVRVTVDEIQEKKVPADQAIGGLFQRMRSKIGSAK
ncbi:MAG: helix-hairpin-helix domain-containing protein [Euryarchaeota archaeon]|nr:helix-hairpin-helix domain-containing protein [Euryarchaeota archaeon]